jgi:hypothetical protein
MRPAPDPRITPGDLLQASVDWVSAALANELEQPLLAVRARIQAARRLAAQDGASGAEVRAALDHLLADADRLARRVARWRDGADAPAARARLQPEQEVALALSLLGAANIVMEPAPDPLAPRITGWPGVIGIATLHLLLSLERPGIRRLQVVRPRPDRLRVAVPGAAPARGADADRHRAAMAAVVARLGGVHQCYGDGDPAFEVPLTL